MAIPHRNGRGGSLVSPSLERPLEPRPSLRGEEPGGSCAQSAHCGLWTPWSCRNDIHACLIRHPAVNRCCKAPRDRTAMKPVLDTGPGLCLIDSVRPGSGSLLGKRQHRSTTTTTELAEEQTRKLQHGWLAHTHPSARREGWMEAGGRPRVRPPSRRCAALVDTAGSGHHGP